MNGVEENQELLGMKLDTDRSKTHYYIMGVDLLTQACSS